MPDENSDSHRDRVIADTGWGIKPDDQPSNASEAARAGRASPSWKYDANEPDVVRKILLAQRRGFNTANRVRIDGGATGGRTTIIDINKDEFVVEGLTFGDENLIPLLESLGAAFNPQELRQLKPTDTTTREYPLSRVWAWGAERSGG